MHITTIAYPCWSEEGALFSHGKYLDTALLSLELPRDISRARYCATAPFSTPPKVSSLNPDVIPPFLKFCRDVKRNYKSQFNGRVCVSTLTRILRDHTNYTCYSKHFTQLFSLYYSTYLDFAESVEIS